MWGSLPAGAEGTKTQPNSFWDGVSVYCKDCITQLLKFNSLFDPAVPKHISLYRLYITNSLGLQIKKFCKLTSVFILSQAQVDVQCSVITLLIKMTSNQQKNSWSVVISSAGFKLMIYHGSESLSTILLIIQQPSVLIPLSPTPSSKKKLGKNRLKLCSRKVPFEVVHHSCIT